MSTEIGPVLVEYFDFHLADIGVHGEQIIFDGGTACENAIESAVHQLMFNFHDRLNVTGNLATIRMTKLVEVRYQADNYKVHVYYDFVPTVQVFTLNRETGYFSSHW